MKKRPKQLIYLAVFLICVAVSLPLQVMMLYGYSPLEVGSILNGLAPLNWAIFFLAILYAICAYRASFLVAIVSPLFLGAVIWNNILIASVDTNFPIEMVTLATAGVFLIQGMLLSRDVRRVLMNPKLRWWLTPQRMKLSLNTKVCPVTGGELIARTFDVSQSGAFVTLKDANIRGDALQRLDIGSHCSIRLNLNQFYSMSCTAQVVRHAGAKGDYPMGFAVRFVGLSREQRQHLTKYLADIPRVQSATA